MIELIDTEYCDFTNNIDKTCCRKIRDTSAREGNMVAIMCHDEGIAVNKKGRLHRENKVAKNIMCAGDILSGDLEKSMGQKMMSDWWLVDVQ